MTEVDPKTIHFSLIRFLARERSAARNSFDDLYSLPVAARVEAGQSVAGVRVLDWAPQSRRVRLALPQHPTGFRVGDRLRIGDGRRPEHEPQITIVSFDPLSGVLLGESGPYDDIGPLLTQESQSTQGLVLDPAVVDLTSLILQAMEPAFEGQGKREQMVQAALALNGVPQPRQADMEKSWESIAKLPAAGFNLDACQKEAFAEGWAGDPFHLIQGPPGTGKTFLLALLLAALCWRGERILVTAQTHLAVDNVLSALARISARTGKSLNLVRVAPKAPSHMSHPIPGIRFVRKPGDLSFPSPGGMIVGATVLGAIPFSRSRPFDRVAFDEASQIPVAHSIPAMLSAARWIFVGDDRQLGPVFTGDHGDCPFSKSIFAHLRGVSKPSLLRTTYRLNSGTCRLPSDLFYAGALVPSRDANSRRFCFPNQHSQFGDVLGPEPGTALVRIDHLGHLRVCLPEAEAVTDLAAELLKVGGFDPKDLAIISPFRAQNQLLVTLLKKKLGGRFELPTIDTVERVQGQEREVVLVSLTCSDPEALRKDSGFFFSPNRLCVTLTRARTKTVIFGSRNLLNALPLDYEGLRRIELFHQLFARLPAFDWTSRYL